MMSMYKTNSVVWLKKTWKKRLISILILGAVFCFYMFIKFTNFLSPVPALSYHVANILDVDYVINANVCDVRGEDVYMLVLVGSHPEHVHVRKVIRRTWGNPMIPNFPFKLLFLFGQPLDSSVQQLLEEESVKYGDVLQGNFVDNYHNITPRDLMGLRWAWEHCSHARFLMRADDDVAMDIYHLIDILEERFAQQPTFVACFYVTRNATVERSDRYGLHMNDYPGDVYPDFCHGWMYMLTPKTADLLVRMAATVPPYWINDVYITGTLVQTLGMQVQDLLFNYSLEFDDVQMPTAGHVSIDRPKFEVLPTKADPLVTDFLQDSYRQNAVRLGLPHHKVPYAHDSIHDAKSEK